MPIQFGKSDEFLRKTVERIGIVEPIIGPPVEAIKEPALGDMNWEERLRTTEEMLQKLSSAYPFTWHGNS